MQKCITSIVILTCLLLSAACTNSVMAPPAPSPSPTFVTTIVDTLPPATETILLSETPQGALAVPERCQATVSNAGQDKEYMDAIKKFAVVTGAYGLINSCNIARATEFNQILTNHTKPASQKLLSARFSLISAISECVGGKTSATRTRAQDAMKSYEEELQDYQVDIKNCTAYLNDDQKQSLLGVAESVETEEGWHFTGTDGDMMTFRIDNSGTYLISYKCTGESKIFVNIKTDYEDLVKTMESAEGQKTGKDTVHLLPGKYYLKVDTVGDWTVILRPE